MTETTEPASFYKMLEQEDIENALSKMAPDERAIIETLATHLEIHYKNRWYKQRVNRLPANFGRTMAIELLAKLGIHMLKNGEQYGDNRDTKV